MPGWIAPAAIAAGTTAADMAGKTIGTKKQHERQKELMGIQFGHQQQLNRQGSDLQYEMWKKTNFPAQMEMLKEAGLSAGLFYGMKGEGGATTGSQGGGAASSGSAPAHIPMEIAAQTAALKSEIDLKKAQAENIEAQTEKTKGADTGKVLAETKLMEIEAAKRPHQLMATVEKLEEEAQKLMLENKVTEDAYKSIVSEIKGRAAGQWLSNELTKAGIKKTNEEIKEIGNSIMQKWEALGFEMERVGIEKDKTKIAAFEAELKAEYPGISQATGNILNKLIRALEMLDGITGGVDTTRKIKK